MRTGKQPDINDINRELSYFPETGSFYRKETASYRKKFLQSRPAGTAHASGLIYIKIAAGIYPAHKIAWLLTYGEWPHWISHKDGNKSNNSIANLELALPKAGTDLSDWLEYIPTTGKFYWKRKPSSKVCVGSEAGSRYGAGYVQMCFRKKHYLAHRVAWYLVHGRWPVDLIDHIDGNPSNNKISNLREATSSLNGANSKTRIDNPVGLKGVEPKVTGYKAAITVNGKKHRVGFFSTPEEAHQTYLEEAKKRFGEFAFDGVRQ